MSIARMGIKLKLKIKNMFVKIPELFKLFQIKYFNTIQKDKLNQPGENEL